MPTTTVAYGQVSDGDVLNAGDTQLVSGIATNTIVNASADQHVIDSGISNNVHVNVGGVQEVDYNAQAFGSVIDGGRQYIYGQSLGHGLSFGDKDGAVDTVVNAGGTQIVFNTAVNTVINLGGTQNVYGNATGTIINAGGLQTVDNSGSLFNNLSVDNTTINAGGVQSIASGTVTNTHLLTGGSIVVQSIQYAPGGTATLDAKTDALTVVDNGNTFTLNLAGDYSTTAFDLSSANGKLEITAHAVCFCRGTRIRTPAGDRPIEELGPKDLVVTADGTVRPVRWVGSSKAIVDDETRPVIVKAGAFPDGTPHRDLRITRGHSFVFGDVLIPIGNLVDGASICWDIAARYVQVFHVELDRHDILLAEGARAESYRDDGNRVGFQVAYGEAYSMMATCLPVVSAGPIVERTRRRVAEHRRTVAQSPMVRGSELVSSAIS